MASNQSSKWRKRLAQLFVAFAFFLGCGAIAFRIVLTKPPGLPQGAIAIAIDAKPIARFEGAPARLSASLTFRDGLELTSADEHFGGLSGIAVEPDGRFTAVADVGNWITGRLVETDGRLSSVVDTKMAPILADDGRTLNERRMNDSESLSLDGGKAYVGLEGVNQILVFDLARDGLSARGQGVPVPRAMEQWPGNAGPEGMAVAPPGTPLAGTIVIVAEGARAGGSAAEGLLVGGPTPGSFSVGTPGGGVSDLAFLPNGDLLLLERRISIVQGLSMRIRRVKAIDIKPGAVLWGDTLIDSDTGGWFDNMEGLAVTRSDAGEIILTLVTDDNFIFFQRTLVLRFTLKN